MNGGIYEILNTKNGHRYVGSSINLAKRKRTHFRKLRRQTHKNAHLQSAWNKYGKDAFELDVLEYWGPEFLISMEQWWMNMLRPEYNIDPVAGSRLGYNHTDEAKAKISKTKTGRKHTTETKAKISKANKGRKRGPHSKEHKAKLRSANIGRKHSKETLAKMSAQRKGKPWTPTQRAARAAYIRGR